MKTADRTTLNQILIRFLTIFTMTLASAVFAFSSHQASAQDDTPSAQINAWANVLRANGEYQKLLSESRLNHARSELVYAQSAGEWQRVRQLTLLVDRAQLQLRLLARDEAVLRRKIKGIEDHARRAQVILTGQVNPSQLQALRWLTLNAIDPNVVYAAMTLEVGPIPDDEFYGQDAAELFNGDNVGQLIDHLQRTRATVRPWGLANQALAKAVVTMANGAAEKLQIIQMNLAALRDQIDPFTLPSDGSHNAGQ